MTLAVAARGPAGRLASLAGVAVVLAVTFEGLGTRWGATATVAGAWAVAVVGLDLLWGRAGQVSLGHGGFVAIGAYTSAILTVDHGWQPLAAMGAGVVLSCAIAIVLGWAVLGLDELYLALATLGFGLFVPSLISVLESITGGPSGIYGIPDLSLGGFAFDDLTKSYVLSWTVAAVAALVSLRLARSRTGLAWSVLAHHPDVAAASGVSVKSRKLEVFVLSAGLASVGGSLYAHFTKAITPDTFGFPLAVLLLTYAIVGGAGTGIGPLLGALAVNAATTYSGQTGQYTELLYGAMFLGVLYLAPGGIVGLVRAAIAAVRPDGRHEQAPFAEAPPVRTAARPDPPVGRGSIASTAAEEVLVVTGVGKSFGGLRALHDVDFGLRPGEVTGLVGANGAGKTTLLNVICGVYRPDHGDITYAGEKIETWSASRRARRGIARTFQTPALVPDLDVVDNAAIGAYRSGRHGLIAAAGSPLARAELRSLREQGLAALERVGLAHLGGLAPDQLSFGQRRRLELARALALEPAVLLLDEPMSGLDRDEKRDLCALVQEIANGGTAVGIVEHDTEVVSSTCSWVTVLELGVVIASEPGHAVFDNEAVRASYMGEAAVPTLQVAP